MKVTVNVECTPEEARTFLGLPDVQPLQKAVLGELENAMRGHAEVFNPSSALTTWIPASVEGITALQRAVWHHIENALGYVTNNALPNVQQPSQKALPSTRKASGE